MKKLFTFIVLIMILVWTSLEAFADTYVKWYFNKNWKYVEWHYRSDADETKLNNWSTFWNRNPYTWEIWTKKYDDYNNYWRNNLPILDYETALSEMIKNIDLEKQATEIERRVRDNTRGANELMIQAEIARQQSDIFNQYSFFNIDSNLLIDNISKKVRYKNHLKNTEKISEILWYIKQVEKEVRSRMWWAPESRVQAEIQRIKINLLNKAEFYEKKNKSNFAFIPLINLQEPKEIYTDSNYNIYDLKKWYCNSKEKIWEEMNEEIKKFIYVYENYINWINIHQWKILPLDSRYNLDNFFKNLDIILGNYENNLNWFFEWNTTKNQLNESFIKYKRALFALKLIDSEKEKIKTNLIKMCDEIYSWNTKIQEIKSWNETTTINKYVKLDNDLDNYNNKNPWVLYKLLPRLEEILKKEKKAEKIELIKHIIEKIKKYR